MRRTKMDLNSTLLLALGCVLGFTLALTVAPHILKVDTTGAVARWDGLAEGFGDLYSGTMTLFAAWFIYQLGQIRADRAERRLKTIKAYQIHAPIAELYQTLKSSHNLWVTYSHQVPFIRWVQNKSPLWRRLGDAIASNNADELLEFGLIRQQDEVIAELTMLLDISAMFAVVPEDKDTNDSAYVVFTRVLEAAKKLNDSVKAHITED